MCPSSREINPEIAVCCGTPIINSMYTFDDSDNYCRKCKKRYQHKDLVWIHSSPEIDKEFQANMSWFYKIARKNYIRKDAYFAYCKKCNKGEKHWKHITKRQAAASNAAWKRLTKTPSRKKS